MYKSILVPLDGSTFSEHAVPVALGIARQTNASLHLAHVHVPLAVVDEHVMASTIAFDAVALRTEREYLARMVQRISSIAPIATSSAMLSLPIAGSLCDYAVAHRTDLVIMTTHGRGPLSRFWLGSVADQLVRQLAVPLLIVRPSDSAPDINQAPAFRNILIPLDGSNLSEQVLEGAMALAAVTNSRCTLLQVVTPVTPIAFYPPAGEGWAEPEQEALETLRALQGERLHAAQSYLEGIAKQFKARSLEVQTQVVAHDQPAAAILDEIRAQNFDLVALATHGRGGIRRLLLGSVADKVIRGAGIAVFVHHPKASSSQ